MCKYSMLSIEIDFLWDQDLSQLAEIFGASKKLCSESPTKISFKFSLADEGITDVGITEVVIKNPKTVSIKYREMVETSICNNLPIWKHEKFIDKIASYLENMNATSSAFSSDKKNYCRCNLRNEGDLDILDEEGYLIKGPYKASMTFSFDISNSSIKERISELLKKSLEQFEQVKKEPKGK